MQLPTNQSAENLSDDLSCTSNFPIGTCFHQEVFELAKSQEVRLSLADYSELGPRLGPREADRVERVCWGRGVGILLLLVEHHQESET